MKTKINLAFTIFAAVIMTLAISGCSSSKKAKKNTVVEQSVVNETEIVQFCVGKEFQSNKDYFRSSGVGESMDQSVAKRKALNNARAEMAKQLEVKIKDVTDNFGKSLEASNKEDLNELFQFITREVSDQKLNGSKVICDRLTKTAQGNYKSYIALELSGDEIAESMRQRLSKNDKLQIEFDYERFKKTFNEEMQKLENDR